MSGAQAGLSVKVATIWNGLQTWQSKSLDCEDALTALVKADASRGKILRVQSLLADMRQLLEQMHACRKQMLVAIEELDIDTSQPHWFSSVIMTAEICTALEQDYCMKECFVSTISSRRELMSSQEINATLAVWHRSPYLDVKSLDHYHDLVQRMPLPS